MSKAKGFFAGSQIKVTEPMAGRIIPQCGACGLYQTCHSPKIEVFGDGARGVLFVGEAPGADEDAQGVPFVGKDGKYLHRVLRGMGFDMGADGWATNAIICRPPKSRKPRYEEVGFCLPNLMNTIRRLKPIVIIPLGAAAVDAVLRNVWQEDIGGINRWVGWDIPCQHYNAWICPTWHPSHVIREEDPVIDRQFKDHLRVAVAHTGKPYPEAVPDWRQEVRKVYDPVKAARWLRKAAACREGAVAWDYETNTLKPEWDTSRIASCAVAWGRSGPEKCIAYPWQGEAIAATQELLRSPIPKIASNLKFEDRWTRTEFGHRVRNWVWDTMLAAHVADNRPGITSVKFQGYVRYGFPVWNDRVSEFLKTRGNETINQVLQEIDIDDLLLYNGLDAFVEFKVAVHQMNELGYPIPWSL